MISKFSQKVNFRPQTSYIIPIMSGNTFSIQFWYKSFFLVHGLKVERERLSNSTSRERKLALAPITTTKIVDYCVK
jgi:hypothetical protein